MKRIYVIALMFIISAGVVFIATNPEIVGCSENGKLNRQRGVYPTPSSDAAVGKSCSVPEKTHIVQEGEFLISIAEKYSVNWEAMLYANETFLQKMYEEICVRYSEKYRNNPGRRGLFCNDRFRRPYGNTLLPGWKLTVPAQSAPQNIEQVVSKIEGDRVALVIDDTGSMTNDRQRVSQFYMAALRQYNKQLAGVWLFTDGHVRRYQHGEVIFLTSGQFENTYHALTEAAKIQPDAIVLVTDEPGDDWDWLKVPNLPPVVAHCLKDEGYYPCETNLKRLAQATKGQYVDGIGN